MKTLLSLIRWEFILQYRYGFYWAGLFVGAVWSVFLSYLPPNQVSLWMPFALFIDLTVVGYMFMGARILFDKSGQTLDTFVVTPAKTYQYAVAKALPLTLLACAMCLMVVSLSHFGSAHHGKLLLAVFLTAWLYTYLGFMVASPFERINPFLVTTALAGLVFNLAALPYFGIWESPWAYLLPTYPALLLLKWPFAAVSNFELYYAFGGVLLEIAVLMYFAPKVFLKVISQRRS